MATGMMWWMPMFRHLTGAWEFTSSSHPGMWDPPKLALAARAGFVFRIDDKTALRLAMPAM